MTPSSADPIRSTAPEPEVWSRAEAIVRLRAALLELCGEERSMCRVAAERGIFCRGFGRWPEREFHERWKPLIGVSTHLSRTQMERLADLWQLSEQLLHNEALACDAQAACPGACRGWGEFDDPDLARFCREILGRKVAISPMTRPEAEIRLHQIEPGAQKPRRSDS